MDLQEWVDLQELAGWTRATAYAKVAPGESSTVSSNPALAIEQLHRTLLFSGVQSTRRSSMSTLGGSKGYTGQGLPWSLDLSSTITGPYCQVVLAVWVLKLYELLDKHHPSGLCMRPSEHCQNQTSNKRRSQNSYPWWTHRPSFVPICPVPAHCVLSEDKFPSRVRGF
jgi:hypothetical protein